MAGRKIFFFADMQQEYSEIWKFMIFQRTRKKLPPDVIRDGDLIKFY